MTDTRTDEQIVRGFVAMLDESKPTPATTQLFLEAVDRLAPDTCPRQTEKTVSLAARASWAAYVPALLAGAGLMAVVETAIRVAGH